MAKSALRLFSTLPLLTRNGTLQPQQPRRKLLLLTGAAMQRPTLRTELGEFI